MAGILKIQELLTLAIHCLNGVDTIYYSASFFFLCFMSCNFRVYYKLVYKLTAYPGFARMDIYFLNIGIMGFSVASPTGLVKNLHFVGTFLGFEKVLCFTFISSVFVSKLQCCGAARKEI